MGLDFSKIENGPDLLEIVRSIDPERLPEDIRKECLEGISFEERAKEGDFLVIWGGSSTCAHTMKQIARLAGLKIISVVDAGKQDSLVPRQWPDSNGSQPGRAKHKTRVHSKSHCPPLLVS